jgi:hypothetical protein
MKSLQTLLAESKFEPTRQQGAFINASGTGKDLVCIARAGTGKTATATAIANHRGVPGFFLLFNRAARIDAEKRLPQHVQSVTGHSFAHQRLIANSRGYQKKIEPENERSKKKLSAALVERALDICGQPQWYAESPRILALAVLETVKAFQISADRDIQVHHIPENVIPIELRMPGSQNDPYLQDFMHEICRMAKLLWQKMADEHNSFPIQHDTYLKLYELREAPVSSEIWLLDEYQDTTPVVASMINQQEGQKIYIGDPCQAIYGWRGAVNALEEPQRHCKTHYLTDSFRFNHQIAEMATTLLRSVGEKNIIRGQPENLRQFNFHQRHTRLVRNNLTMIDAIAECMHSGQPVYIPGGLSPDVVAKVKSAYALYCGDMSGVTVGGLKKMGSWKGFEEFARQQPEKQNDYLTLFNLIEKIRGRSIDIIEYASRPYDNTQNKDKQVTLITAHRAKGREWPMVSISADLAIPETTADKVCNGEVLTSTQREQVNLMYVAITRAAKGIHLAAPVKATINRLHQIFKDPDATPDQFVADETARAPKSNTQEDIKQRTREFILRHRRQD